MIGTIHDDKVLFLRMAAGTATQGKKVYDLSTNIGGGNPIVISKQTGKTFSLSWTEIINMAIELGIDKPVEVHATPKKRKELKHGKARV